MAVPPPVLAFPGFVFERTPKEASGTFCGFEVVVVPFVVVVVVYCNELQVTISLVAPLTLAVRLVDCPRMRTKPAEELIVTVTTLAPLLLPQPLKESKHRTASAPPASFKTAVDLRPTISPTP